MKFKKAAAMILTSAMLFCAFPVCGAQSELLQFEDDFSSSDNVSWSIRNESMRVTGGMLISDTDKRSAGQSRAAINAKSAQWQDFRAEFDFMPTDYNDDSFFYMNIRECDKGNVMLIFRRSGINYIYSSGWETGGINVDFSKNTKYKISVEASGEDIDISVSNNTGFVSGKISGAPVMRGEISVGTYGLSAGVDNFKVYNTENPAVYFPKTIEKLERGENRKIAAAAVGAENVTYTSDAPDIVSVSADGTVTAAAGANGSALITATAEFADGTTCTASYDAVIIIPLKGTGFDIKNTELYVGENANVRAAVRPADANKTKLIWRNDSPESIELFGNYNDSRGIIAKGVTDDAVISLLDGDGKLLDKYHVKVIERPEEEKKISYTWRRVRKIPENFFGMNSSDWLSMLGQAKTEQEFEERTAVLKELIGNVNVGFTRAILEGYDWKTGKRENQADNTPGYGIDKVVGMTGSMNIPMCISADMGVSAEDAADMVREIRKTNLQPLYLEVGNECYDINYAEKTGTVEEFMEHTAAVYRAVKAVDEEVKIAVPILDYELSYMFSKSDSAVYDQGARGKTWNSYIAAHPECYDAVVIHSYSGAGLSYSGADDIMENFSRASEMLDYGVINMAENLFPGKEFWITEFGDLPSYITDGSCESEKSRLQYMKSVGNAVGYVQKLLTAAENPYIENIAYHTFNDTQGFGSVHISSDGVTLLPSYYAFEQSGKLLRDYSYIYECDTGSNDKELFSETQLYPNVPDVTSKTERVKVWGFGNGGIPEKIAAVNTSAYPVKISVDGLELKQTFVYGSDNPLPDFAIKTDPFWTDLPSVIPQPSEIEDEEFENEIILPPYSMTVADAKENAHNIIYAIAALYDNDTLLDVKMARVTDDSYHFEGSFNADGNIMKLFVFDGRGCPRAETITYREDTE